MRCCRNGDGPGMTRPLDVQGSDRPATAFDLAWQEQADSLEVRTLPNLRQAAQKWAATVGSLTGLLAITAFVKGPSDLAKVTGSLQLTVLDITWRTVIGLLLASALSAASASIVLAALAAQGSPSEFRFTGEELRRRYRTESKRAAAQLKWSRILAIASVPLLSAALAVLWLASPKAPSSPSPALVTTLSGATYCGELLPSSDGIRLKTGGGEQLVQGSDVKSVTGLLTCP